MKKKKDLLIYSFHSQLHVYSIIRQTCQELLYFSVLQLIEAHFIHLQLVLLLLALVSVPWMLLPKPFLLKRQHEVCSFKLLRFCPLNIVVFLYHVLSSFSLHCLSEAPGRILCTPSRYRGVSAIRGTPWRFSRSRGVWIQRSFCTSAYTHNRICPWGSFKYSFLSSFMGSQVKITLKLRKEKGISIHPFLHTMEILENFFFLIFHYLETLPITIVPNILIITLIFSLVISALRTLSYPPCFMRKFSFLHGGEFDFLHWSIYSHGCLYTSMCRLCAALSASFFFFSLFCHDGDERRKAWIVTRMCVNLTKIIW